MNRSLRTRTATAVVALLILSAQAQGLELNVGVGGIGAGVSVDHGGLGAEVHTPGADVRGTIDDDEGNFNQGDLFERNRPPSPPPDPAKELLKLGEPTIRLLVGNLSPADKKQLLIECEKVLRDPQGFSEELIQLCRIVERQFR